MKKLKHYLIFGIIAVSFNACSAKDNPIDPVTEKKDSVLWDKKIGVIRPENWGFNDFAVVKQNAADPNTAQFISSIKTGYVRIHQAGLVNAWIDNNTKTWNKALIKQRLDYNYAAYGNAKVMITLSEWPEFLSTETVLPLNKHAELVSLFSQLPGIMKELGFKVEYYEILNEKDENYDKAGQFNQYCQLVKECATGIKNAAAALNLNYTVKAGGPALRYPNVTWYKTFIDIAGADVDFVSWHYYGGGTSPAGETDTQRNANVFSKVDGLSNSATNIVAYTKSKGYNHLETFLNEFNVQYVWTPYEPRHHNNIGAVWIACLIKRMALTELTGAAIWNVKDGAYGLSRNGIDVSAPGVLYQWGGKYLVGDIVKTTSLTPAIELFAVKQNDQNRTILYLNRSEGTLNVKHIKESMNVDNISKLVAYKLDASVKSGENWIAQQVDLSAEKINMEPYSLLLVTTNLN